MATVIGDLFVRLGVDATNLTRGLETAEKRLESLGTRFFFLGSRVTAGVTLPIIGATAAVAKWGIDFDKAMTESLAIMSGVTPKLREELETVAKDVALTTKFSAEEAAKGYFSLASAGLNAAESMGALPIAARFAQAAVMQLDQATHYLAASQAAMGTGTETSAEKVAQMARVSDVLTEANNRALGTIRDFADALTNRAGVALRITNKDIEEGTAVLAAYASRGIMGKNAGTQLWMMMRDLQHAALENGDAFKKYNVAVFNSTGAMRNMADILGDVERATKGLTDAQKTQMMAELGMPQRSRAATIAILGTSQAIRGHEAALRASAGATQEVADKQMKALYNRLVQLGEQFQAVGITLFNQFKPGIEWLIDVGSGLASRLGEWVKWFGQLPPWIKTSTVAVLALAAAVGPLVAMFGSFTLLFAAGVKGFQQLSGAVAKTALDIGLAIGASGRYAFVTASMTAAQQAASIAAYTQARALGQTWAQAVGAGRAAAASAGQMTLWGSAAASAGVTTGSLAKLLGGLPGMLAGVALAGASLVSWAGSMAAGFLKVTAAVNMFWPAIKQLFTEWNLGIGSIGGSTDAFTGVVNIIKSAFGVFNEVTTTAGHGLQTLVRFIQGEAVIVMENMRARMKQINQEGETWGQWLVSWIPGGEYAARVIRDDINAGLEKMPRFIRAAADGWHYFRLQAEFAAEGGADAMALLSRQIDEMRAKLPKPNLPTARVGADVPKPEMWMLGGQSDFMKRLAIEQKKLADMNPFDAPPSKQKGPISEQEREIRKFREQLVGQTNDIDRLQAAWGRLTPAQQANAGVQEKLWAQYSKLRGEYENIVPAFEAMFATQIQQIAITARIKAGVNEWGIVMSDNAGKIVDEIAQIDQALLGMTRGEKDVFFERHGNAIKELLPMYGQLGGSVQILIDEYYRFEAAQSRVTSKIPGLAAKATEAMDELLRGTAAKLADVQTDIFQFSENAGATHRRNVRNRLNQIKADQEKNLLEMYKAAAFYSGQELIDHYMKIEEQKQQDAAYVRAVERYEQLRFMASIGVNNKIIRDHQRLTKAELDEIIKRQLAWNEFMRDMQAGVSAVSNMGKLADILGMDELGTSLQGIGAGLNDFFGGMETYRNAENLGGQIAGIAQAATGAASALQAMYDTAGRGNRAASGALTGAAIGGSVGGGPGAVAGAFIGALTGFVMSPGWEKVGNDVQKRFQTTISKDLMKVIESEAKIWGSHFNSELMNLGHIIEAGGGLSAGNVGKWAAALRDVFVQIQTGALKTTDAAKALDNVFTDLAEAGMSTNGVLNKQVLELIKLEQHFRTGSKAISEFVQAQLGIAAGGFNQLASGVFGPLVTGEKMYEAEWDKQVSIQEKIMKLRAQIADYERDGVKNEKQKVALYLARVNLARQERALRESEDREGRIGLQIAAFLNESETISQASQDKFDAMGRLALVTFQGMISSGKGFFESLSAIGDGLDTLIVAQQMFGFESTETFAQLMKFREFANLHPDIVSTLDGLNAMMTGLHNAGYMTHQAFTDLGSIATDTFNRMIAGGLTSDEAMMAMHPTLQRLWEMQRAFGYQVDEATQALIDEAVAAGTVGTQYMSANDRMVLGIDKLISRFELFLRHLGIDLPREAEESAAALVDAFESVEPEVHIRYRYPDDVEVPDRDTPAYAKGGVVTRPHVGMVGESGPEAIIPLDRLFNEIEVMNRKGDGGHPISVNVYLDRRVLASAVLKEIPNQLNLRGV